MADFQLTTFISNCLLLSITLNIYKKFHRNSSRPRIGGKKIIPKLFYTPPKKFKKKKLVFEFSPGFLHPPLPPQGGFDTHPYSKTHFPYQNPSKNVKNLKSSKSTKFGELKVWTPLIPRYSYLSESVGYICIYPTSSSKWHFEKNIYLKENVLNLT